MSLQGGDGRGRRRIRRRQTLSEINVTPLVDVMLVLLIIFMISAPLLTVGVEVELPKTEAQALSDSKEEPLTVSIRRDGAIFIQETAIDYAELAPRLTALAGEVLDKPIYVRADGGAPYEAVARVMAKLSTSGFTKINLITDTAGNGADKASKPDAG
ncbi:protein TolR [Caulobacter sp. 17J65-9]|uniref:protein TolR n=1 Tax=Caulobacter sp. 17J65-9 TaxID=2709382 RepID=UPI0013C73BBC|nr:protein TolR [Caulobacter sp. 17J65-9]NEX91644.1 protein TolR [Caulobacter sp. 17J65-9]